MALGKKVIATSTRGNAREYDASNFTDGNNNTALYCRNMVIKEVKKDKNYFLRFDGILRESWIFVNDIEVGHQIDETLSTT